MIFTPMIGDRSREASPRCRRRLNTAHLCVIYRLRRRNTASARIVRPTWKFFARQPKPRKERRRLFGRFASCRFWFGALQFSKMMSESFEPNSRFDRFGEDLRLSLNDSITTPSSNNTQASPTIANNNSPATATTPRSQSQFANVGNYGEQQQFYGKLEFRAFD